jgi:phosphinothricin acetyltransferase
MRRSLVQEMNPLTCNLAVIPLMPSHAKFWMELYRDEEVKKQMYTAPTDSEQALLDYLKPRSAFTVFLNDQPIGGFTITNLGNRLGTFGFVIHPNYRGLGLASAIIKELEIKAKEMGIATLRADVYSDNTPSIKALESAGFRPFVWLEKNI